MAKNRSALLVVSVVFLVAVTGLALIIARSGPSASQLTSAGEENFAGEAWRSPNLRCVDKDENFGKSDIYQPTIVTGYNGSLGKSTTRSDFCDPTGINGKLHEFSCTTTAADRQISERIVTCQTACNSGACLRGRGDRSN